MFTGGAAMTVQEVKKLIRQRVRQELGSVPEALYETLWRVRDHNLRELVEDDVCEADILVGDVGMDYVDAMALLLSGWDVAQRRGIASASRFPPKCSICPDAEVDLVTLLWDALPERDQLAMKRVWLFAYNALEPHAREFRQRFTRGRTMTQSEAVEWITAKENGCREVSARAPADESWYYVEDREVYYEGDLKAVLDRQYFIISMEDRSPLQSLALFAFLNDTFLGLPAQVILLFMLTGQKLPPRIPVMWLSPTYNLAGLCSPQQAYNVVPLLPPYLSAEGVEKVWRAFNYDGNVRSWILFHYRLNEFSSFEEALRVWNEVAPAEWRINDYRTFHRLWWRAGLFEREKEKPRAVRTYSDDLEEAIVESADCFGILPFLLPEEIMPP